MKAIGAQGARRRKTNIRVWPPASLFRSMRSRGGGEDRALPRLLPGSERGVQALGFLCLRLPGAPAPGKEPLVEAGELSGFRCGWSRPAPFIGGRVEKGDLVRRETELPARSGSDLLEESRL